MVTKTKTFTVETKSQLEFVNISEEVQQFLKDNPVKDGRLTIFIPHTTAGITINQDEALLQQDLLNTLYRLVPVTQKYSHDSFEVKENVSPDMRSNGHSHCQKLLLSSSETILIENGQLILGPIQSILLVELDGGRERKIILQIQGA